MFITGIVTMLCVSTRSVVCTVDGYHLPLDLGETFFKKFCFFFLDLNTTSTHHHLLPSIIIPPWKKNIKMQT